MKSTIDMIRAISFEMSKAYRGKTANIGGAVISTAYALSKISKTPMVSSDSLETFVKTAHVSHEVSEVLSRNLNGLWETVLSYTDKFDADVLEEVVLYENSFFEMSTPASIVKLAGRILSINEQDKVLDICSGSATFPIYAFQDTKPNEYTGVEINFNANDVAILRGSLLGDNCSFVINNALTYQYPTNYDKIFSNYPFGLRGADLDECRRELQAHYGLDSSCVSRCSSDWLFNAIIIRSLKETGKAVAIMTNGAVFNKPDMYMRQYFAENGYIEAVINLPPALFIETAIPTTMIVFSYNNTSIRLVNAENTFSKEGRRLNTLSDDNISYILDCINNGGDNTIDVAPADMRDQDYNLMASHYLEKPVVENGICFGDIINNIARGSQVKPELLESYKSIMPTNYRFISLANVTNGSIDIEEGQQYITELPKALEKFVIPNNSIVLSKMASPTFRSAVVNSDNDHSIIATGNLYIIEIDENKADPYYIQAFFDSLAGEAALNYVSGGSAVKTISVEAVKSIMIPLPSLEEQKIIAQKYQAALDEYTVLKRKMKKVLERKRTLLENEG
ncbi:MAG: N-6 DNA methylase [Porcipelethomonas sp.]